MKKYTKAEKELRESKKDFDTLTAAVEEKTLRDWQRRESEVLKT